MLQTPQEVQRAIADRFKARRLVLNLTQEGLAERAGVSWGSLKRFEAKGLIALDGLLRIALVLECLDDFEKLASDDEKRNPRQSLDVILAKTKPRLRAANKRASKKGRTP